MKLTKREQLAFNSLREILDTFERGEVLEVTNKEQNAIQEVFNINLYETTYRKSQIAEFKRGKDTAHIVLLNRVNREPFSYGYFPFQVKKDREEERAKEVAEIKKRETEKIRQIHYYPIIEHLNRLKDKKQIKQTNTYDMRKAKQILTTDYYDCFNLTKEEKNDLLDLIIQVEKNAIKEG